MFWAVLEDDKIIDTFDSEEEAKRKYPDFKVVKITPDLTWERDMEEENLR